MCFGKYPSSNPKNIKPHNTIHSLSGLFVQSPNLYNASIVLPISFTYSCRSFFDLRFAYGFDVF
ncbi:hypothetical protein HanHA300_Chr14g0517841 [Helianthus annuus]|nr:hypothetical protein HanHA300_Chr14g0517841 [Helianthus annuus]KAJ0467798.1 hypothetical protein HanIR_Chr14g0689291 [Helianthus annuus]